MKTLALNFKSMSYEELSRYGLTLMQKSVASGAWFSVLDEMVAIRDEMERKENLRKGRDYRAALARAAN